MSDFFFDRTGKTRFHKVKITTGDEIRTFGNNLYTDLKMRKMKYKKLNKVVMEGLILLQSLKRTERETLMQCNIYIH